MSDRNRIHKMILGTVREERVKQGFFDGRFNQRTVESKKKYNRKTKHKNRDYGC